MRLAELWSFFLGDENLQASHEKYEEDSQLLPLVDHQSGQTRQGENKNCDVGEDMWQADVAVACHDIDTMTIDGVVPLEFKRLTDGEGRNDIGNGMGYAHPNNNECAESHSPFRKDPQIHDQDCELGEQACSHVDKLGRRLKLEIIQYDRWIGNIPVSHMAARASTSEKH
jgi:hypothetical protein